MSDTTIRFGVVGLGAIAPSHIFAIEQTDGAELAAVCDIRADVAGQVGREQGVPHFTDVGEMAAAGIIDVATIGTPNAYHLEPGLQLLKAGKHILVEKPLEITTQRIDQLIAAAKQGNAKIACVFQSRFKPLVGRLQAFVAGGGLGDLYNGSATIKYYRKQEYYDSGAWRGTWEIDGGGCLMNQGVHCIDLFLWFMGQAQEVIGFTSSVGRDVEVETLAQAMATFTSGARGTIQASTLAYPGYDATIELIGSRGSCAFSANRMLHMDLMDPTPAEATERDAIMTEQERRDVDAANAPKTKVEPGTAVGSVDMGHTPVVEDLVTAIHENRDPLISGSEGRRSVEFITGIYESARNGSRPVCFEP